MNSLLETLNVWADHALQFAWPMLWQSSLLIGVLFALDLVLRKKLRPAVRYALWLVVVVKVLLPPSLAFPTGPSWWLRPAQVAPPNPRPTPVVVTYSTEDQPTPLTVVTPAVPMPPYRPHLSPSGWALIVTATVSLALFAWMLVRWYQVARDSRRATAAPAWLGELLPEPGKSTCTHVAHDVTEIGHNQGAQPTGERCPGREPSIFRVFGVFRGLTIRLTDRPQSPAVCGLFRPVILLPRALADHLPPAQLRAVLLHELVHLRRGDVWVNCLQALVQILYWWHPLLWLANARIRRVREEAVDDAVMLALNEEADTYAPTLLEVAKLSLHRPLASLGLVGILESRSSLRQRIERLLDFRPPRKAGLTLGAVLAVVAFAAVAVPMGEAPAPSHETRSGPLSLSLSPSEGERVPKAGEGLVLAPGAWQEALAAAQDSPSAANPLTTTNLAPSGPPTSGLPGDQPPLYTRSFWINQSNLLTGLHVPMRPVGTNDWPPVVQPLVYYLSQAGVDLDPHRNPGKALFYSYGHQALLVRATLHDLDIVEQKLEAMGALVKQSDEVIKQNLEVNTLVRDGKLLFEMGRTTAAEAKLKEALKQDPQNQAAAYYLKLLRQDRVNRLVQDGKRLYEQGWLEEAELDLEEARREDPHDIRASYYLKLVREALHKPTGGLRKALPVRNHYSRTNLVHTGQGRQGIVTKLDRIHLDSVGYDGQPLGEVVRLLSDESKKRDPEQRGVNFLVAAATNGTEDLSSLPITINPPLKDIRLADVMAAIVKVAGKPIKYSIEDDAVVFSAKTGPDFYVRTFKVDPNTMVRGLQSAKVPLATNGLGAIERALRDYFARVGVDLDPTNNPGKSLFFNERQGMLIIRATMLDLDIIEAAIQVLLYVPPQINIKCKFAELSEEDIKVLNFDSWGKRAGNAGGNGQVAGLASSYNSMVPFTVTKVLTKPQFDMAIKALQQRQGAQLLAEMEVTSNNGRQVQCKSTDYTNILTVINPRALSPPGISSTNVNADAAYMTERLEIGPVLDAYPTVLEDGYTVSMRIIATVLEFFGYDGYRTNSVAVYVNGQQKWASPPLPDLRQRQMDATARVWDGQTLVLSNPALTVGDPQAAVNGMPAEKPGDRNRRLIVMVTPTIIDSTGRRVHSDNEMPFARDGIPPQPAR